MKIKILNSSGWYNKNLGEEFEIEEINYDKDSNARFESKNNGWIYSEDCVITELPGEFCVRRCDDKEKWDKYVKWLNKKFYRVITSSGDYPFYGKRNTMDSLGCFKSFGTEIHIDDIIKHINFYSEPMPIIEIKEEENKEMQKLSRKGLKEIHSVACTRWKVALEHYGTRNPLEDYVELSHQEVQTMLNECTKEQLIIVSKYLKEDDLSVYFGDKVKEIRVRKSGEYANKSLTLNDVFDWQIKKDSEGKLCLIPTKKK